MDYSTVKEIPNYHSMMKNNNVHHQISPNLCSVKMKKIHPCSFTRSSLSTNQKKSKTHTDILCFSFLLSIAVVAGFQDASPCYPGLHVFNRAVYPTHSSRTLNFLIPTLDKFQLNNGTRRVHPIRKRTHTHVANGAMRIPTSKTNFRLQMTSTSGIDMLPELVQASIFIGVYAALGLATVPTSNLINGISKSIIGLERWRDSFIETSLPLLLGAFYLSAGVGHFVAMDAFASIYPPIGTWGIWYLPGSANFHVAWTGLVEVFGGLGLMLSGGRKLLGVESDEDDGSDVEEGLLTFNKLLVPLTASALFLLTVIVTPANIYMYTHGAMMGDASPPFDLTFHLVRFGVQVVVLNLLLTLARDSFFFAWGDELD